MGDHSKKVCRTCLNKNIKMVWIGADHIVCENVMSVSELIMACAPVKITIGDDLPQYVCRNCIYSAERAYNFRLKCEKTNAVFQKKASKSNSDKVYICPKCSVEYKVMKDFISHVFTHSETELQFHQCKYCSNSFFSAAALKKHLKFHIRKENNRTKKRKAIERLQEVEIESTVTISDLEKQNFSCCYCDEQFSSDSELQLHKETHTNIIKTEIEVSENPNLQCLDCDLVFETEDEFLEHLKVHAEVESVDDRLTCKLCSKIFEDIVAYSEHVLEHRKKKTTDDGKNNNFECEICSLTFLNKEKLTSHMKIHVKHYCEICSLNFDSAELLGLHIVEHNDENNDKSNDDDMDYEEMKDVEYLQSDNEYIEDFEPKKCNSESKMFYSCKLCSCQYHNFREIKNHLTTHEIRTKELFKNLCYKCEECSNEFVTIYEFFKHKITDNGDVVSNVFTLGPRRKRIYGCTMCSKKFPSPSSLRNHERTHTNKWPKSCTYCPQIINNLQELMQHCNMLHEDKKEFACDICGKKFFALKNLKIHKKTHSEKTHMCDICGHSFQAYNNLLSHRRLHTGDKPYKCTQCPKAFAQHASLRSHLLNHNDERNYQCPVCEKRFRRSGALHTHKKTHTGIKDYTCEICERKFAASSTRKKHMLTHTGERNYVCDICNKAFGRKSNLTVHRKIHTGERPNVCEICGKGFLQAHVLRSHLNTHKKHMQATQVAAQAASSSD